MRNHDKGFTLAELLVVMAILAAGVVVIAPYATRRNHNQAMSDAVSDLVNSLRYAHSYATRVGKPTRLILECQDHAIRLEESSDMHGRSFSPLEGVPGSKRGFDEQLYFTDIDGFEMLSEDAYALKFDPQQPWPHATLTIMSDEKAKKIVIQGKNIDVISLH